MEAKVWNRPASCSAQFSWVGETWLLSWRLKGEEEFRRADKGRSRLRGSLCKGKNRESRVPPGMRGWREQKDQRQCCKGRQGLAHQGLIRLAKEVRGYSMDSTPQTLMFTRLTGELVKTDDWVPHPEILIQKIWDGIWERVLPIRSQVMRMLLVQGPHCENHCRCIQSTILVTGPRFPQLKTWGTLFRRFWSKSYKGTD